MKLSILGVFNKVVEFGSSVAAKVVGRSKAEQVAQRAIVSPPAPRINTELHDACEQGNIVEVRRLLANQDPDFARRLTRTASLDGHFPLSIALGMAISERDKAKKAVYEEIAELLLRAGADVNAAQSLGTPFLRACEGGSWNLARLFLDYGANVNAVNDFGYSALFLVNEESWVEFLLENGADVNIQAKDDSTPLSQACLEGRTALAKRLLNQGANPEGGISLDKSGQALPPLHLASKNNNLEIAKALITAGARAGLSFNGQTPLDLCMGMGYEEMIDLLIQRGAFPSSAEKRANIFARYPKYQQVFNGQDDLRHIAAKKLALSNHIKSRESCLPEMRESNSISPTFLPRSS